MENEQERNLRERLNTMFSRYNYVGIKNILETPFKWTVALEQNEILNMGPADTVSEDEWISKKQGQFLPHDGVLKGKTKVVNYELAPGEKKMILGEAAYVLIEKMYMAYIKEKYVPDTESGEIPDKNRLAATKAGMAKIRNPHFQDQVIPQILVGPIIKNVDGALQTYVNEQVGKIEGGFTDVQADQPKETVTEAPRRGRSPKEVANTPAN